MAAAFPEETLAVPHGMSRRQVARRLRRSETQVRRFESQGRLVGTVHNGKHLFDPRTVEALAQELGIDDEAPPSDLATRVAGVADVLASTQGFASEAFSLLLRSVQSTNASLLSDLHRVSEENRHLHKELRELRAQHREWLDLQAEQARADKREELKLEEQRKWHETGRQAIKPLVPGIMAMVGKATGFPMPGAVDQTILNLLADLDAEQRSAAMKALFPILKPHQSLAFAAALESAKSTFDVPTRSVTERVEGAPPPDDAPLPERIAYWSKALDASADDMQAAVARTEEAERKCDALKAEAETRKVES